MKKTTWKKSISVALAAAMMAGNVYLPASSALSKIAIVEASETTMPENPAVVDGMVYATVDMEYEDFYYGELNSITDVSADGLDLSKDVVDTAYADGEYDAVTSATASKSKNFPATYYSENVANDETNGAATGVNINGVKSVKIAIPEALYKKLYEEKDGTNKNHKVYEYLKNATYSETAFDEYKELNGDGTFKKMTTETAAASSDITAQIATTSSWGNYQISVSNLPNTVTTTNMMGVVLEDEDGKKYGLLHEDNLWFKTGEISFAVVDGFVEPHGNDVSYRHTKDLQGKTIKKITYLLSNGEDIEINTNLYCKPMLTEEQKITATNAAYDSKGTEIALDTSKTPEGADYTVSKVQKGSGRGAVTLDAAQYSYEGGMLKLDGTVVVGDNYTVTLTSDQYADTKVSFEIQAPVIDGYVYAAINMEYEDFYYGELKNLEADGNKDANLNLAADVVDAAYADGEYDAVTSATTTKSQRFGAAYFDTDVANDETSGEKTGVTINGIKDTKIRISENLYNKLKAATDTNHKVFTYLKKATYSDTAFDEYKELKADGTFAKMETETEKDTDANVSFTTTSSWGNYQLSIDNLGLEDTTISTDNMMGVVITAEDDEGKQTKYGLLHEDNLWLQPQEVSFAVVDGFVEPHGNHVAYKHTQQLQGKTITNITYLVKDGKDISIDTNTFVKKLNTGNVRGAADAATYSPEGSKVKINFENLPDNYTLSKVQKGSGKRAVTLDKDLYSYDQSTNTLTLDQSCVAGNDYSALFVSDSYADIKVAMTVNKRNQVISGTSNYTKTYGDGAFSLNAAADAGTLIYTSSNQKVATVDANGKVTIKGAGTANITVKTEGNDCYNAAQKTVKITVNKKKSTMTGSSSFTKVYGSKAFSLGIKTNGAAVKYASSNTKVAVVNANNTVSIKGTGIVTITVTAGDADYTTETKKITIKVTPKKQSVKAKAGKKKVTIQWKKDTKATGYKIQISTKKNFKGAKTYTVKSYKTYKKVVKKLKSKKKYYVRVRAYKTSGKTTLYGAYSSRQKVTVK